MRRAPLLALVLLPIVFPLLVLAASPRRLLFGLPSYRYDPLAGDAYGYYYCARAIIATIGRDAPIVALVVVVVLVAAIVVIRRSESRSTWALAVIWGIGAVAALLALLVPFSGAPEFGWPLVLSVPMLPLRVLDVAGPDEGFAIGLTISVASNIATVVATYLIGRRVGFTAVVSVVGAALVSFWPLLMLLASPHESPNGSWQDYMGLSTYTEPLSMALVTTGLALLVDQRLDDLHAAYAGGLLGLATLVRVSNVLIAGCALAFLIVERRRATAAVYAVGAAAFAPAVLLFWPKGYPKLKPPVFPAHPFALSYASHAWTDSYLWHPVVVVVLLPIALLGLRRSAKPAAALLWGSVGVTALFYTFYELTPLHPRFLFVVLPIVLVFWAAGAGMILAATRGLYDRAR